MSHTLAASAWQLEPQRLTVFVYGTLRHGCPSGAHQAYLHGADLVARAKIRGRLYRLGSYPGLVLSEEDQWVQGEVYILGEALQLQRLDEYEGCAQDSPLPHEYARRRAEVVLASGGSMYAWVYVYIQPTQALEWISSGDFLVRD